MMVVIYSLIVLVFTMCQAARKTMAETVSLAGHGVSACTCSTSEAGTRGLEVQG